MAISYGLGTSALIPGVVADTASRPVAPYEGQVIFQKDTDQLLVWNGTAWVIPNSPAQNPTGLELITSGTLSGTTTNFVGCFTNNYDNYKIIVDKISFSTPFSFYWRALQGASPLTTSVYAFATTGINAAGVVRNVSNTSQPKGYLGIDIAFANSVLGWVTIEVFTPLSTERTVLKHQAQGYNNNFESQNGMSLFNSVGAASVHDGIQFLADGSSVTMNGNVTIYGYRK